MRLNSVDLHVTISKRVNPNFQKHTYQAICTHQQSAHPTLSWRL